MNKKMIWVILVILAVLIVYQSGKKEAMASNNLDFLKTKCSQYPNSKIWGCTSCSSCSDYCIDTSTTCQNSYASCGYTSLEYDCSTAPQCDDTDGGIYDLNPGIVAQGSSTYTDSCIDSINLEEWYCSGGDVASTNINCQSTHDSTYICDVNKCAINTPDICDPNDLYKQYCVGNKLYNDCDELMYDCGIQEDTCGYKDGFYHCISSGTISCLSQGTSYFCHYPDCNLPYEQTQEVEGDCVIDGYTSYFKCCKYVQPNYCVYQSNQIPAGGNICVGTTKVFCSADLQITTQPNGCASTPTCLHPDNGAKVDVGFKYCRWNYPLTEYAYECLSNGQWQSQLCQADCNDATGQCYTGECHLGLYRNERCKSGVNNVKIYDKCGTDRYWDNNLEETCQTNQICSDGQCINQCTCGSWSNSTGQCGSRDCNPDGCNPESKICGGGTTPTPNACELAGLDCMSFVQSCGKDKSGNPVCKVSGLIWGIGILFGAIILMKALGGAKK